jgi:hypothetical protein
MEKQSRTLAWIVIASLFVAAIFTVTALVPIGPSTFTIGESETQNVTQYSPQQHGAYAGNITLLTIHGTSQTKHWQGYYGDITGTIVLDDAQGWTLYDWPQSEPKGEIYATANSTTPTWSNATCFNYTSTGLGTLAQWESFYSMVYNDVDGINETFNMTQHPTLDVGDVKTITQNTCPSTYTHMSDNFQTDKFVELLLTDQEGRLVFTTVIENDDTANNSDIVGFDNAAHDFQLLVAEDGTSRVGGQINTLTTTYYFYVDIQ